MRVSASAAADQRNKMIAMIVFGIVVAGYGYFEFFRDTAPPAGPPPPPVIVTVPANSPAAGPAAKTLGTTSAALDPTLHMDGMLVTESVEYQGTGRNIFSAVSAPTVVEIPKPIADARPAPAIAQAPPPPPPTTCPPICPPIELKFVGFFVSPGTGAKQVILLHGDEVSLASAGEIVQRRYKVVTISANYIQVEDMPNSNTQMLPLLTH